MSVGQFSWTWGQGGNFRKLSLSLSLSDEDQTDLRDGNCANTRQGFPGGPMMLMPSQGADCSELVDHPDVVAVRNVHPALWSDCNP